jgi:hypothetical protein
VSNAEVPFIYYGTSTSKCCVKLILLITNTLFIKAAGIVNSCKRASGLAGNEKYFSHIPYKSKGKK